MRLFTRISLAVVISMVLQLVSNIPVSADLNTFAATRYTLTGYGANIQALNGDSSKSYVQSNGCANFYSKIDPTRFQGAAWSSSTATEFRTFCVDLGTNIGPSNFNYAKVYPVSGAIANSGGLIRNVAKAAHLVNQYMEAGGTNFNASAWNILAASASDTLVSIGDAEKTAILQMAIWAKTYGATGTVTITGGETTTRNRMNALLAQMLTSTTNGTAGFIEYPPMPGGSGGGFNSQDMLYAVPEPTAALLVGGAFLACSMVRLKRRGR